MIQIIYRKRNKEDLNKWDRCLVKAKEGDIKSVDFINPAEDTRAQLIPLEDNLYLLDYLKISFPSSTTVLTIGMILDRIPKDIIKNVYAVELQMLFDNPWYASLFFEDSKAYNYVAFIALLTKKNTRKPLPCTKLTGDRPIGISDDDWNRIVKEFYLTSI